MIAEWYEICKIHYNQSVRF